ncbi:MAG: HD domain-containing protein [Candidatus Micrarchaeota archaeon]|nr:HD domain-containing protein [Candidatus Micrarchaeota archaeon]
MEISDLLYGSGIQVEPVIEELIKSAPLQRLRGINQSGVTRYIKGGRTNTRFSHCVGVMLLLKMLDAPLEEQIAGLLHDVPHTAFSHVVDFVFKNDEHEYHEKFHEKIIMESEIPNILRKHSYDVDFILDNTNFSLLEKKLPALCADRIDYTLRDWSVYFGLLERMKGYLNFFTVHKNEIIMSDGESARNFAEDYLKIDYEVWSDPLEIAAYQIAGDAIRMAMERGILVEDDLFMNDDFVFSILKNSGDAEITELIEKLNPNLKIKIDKKDYDFHAKSKLRYIDPKFIDSSGRIKKVSTAYPDFKEKLKEHNRIMKKGFYVKIVSW